VSVGGEAAFWGCELGYLVSLPSTLFDSCFRGLNHADLSFRGTRVLGSVIGLYGAYAWEWYFWREAHEYFMSPFSVFLWMTSLLCDCLYPFVLWQVRKTERILEDGRKVSGDAVNRGVVAKLD